MQIYRDADIDPAPITTGRVAVIGYGNQGRAQALNLHDGGIDVRVGLREGSPGIAHDDRRCRAPSDPMRPPQSRPHYHRLQVITRFSLHHSQPNGSNCVGVTSEQILPQCTQG